MSLFGDECLGPEWYGEADRAIRRLARKSDVFTASDVWKALKAKPPVQERFRLGGLMRSLSEAGVIRACGVRTAKSASRNRGYETKWRGVRRK